jgi:cysteine dioxygenase
MNLEELINNLKILFTDDFKLALEKRFDVEDLLMKYDISLKDWEKYAIFDNNKLYTRNLIATDNKHFTLLLLCWNPNKSSLIHDHPCENGCWMRVIDNSVNEKQYKIENDYFYCISDKKYEEGVCTYINDDIGYHKISNTTNNNSVTLHLYSPPFNSCRIWNSEDNINDFSNIKINL